MKEFIIIGGNFKNTGAEAMTYITISELRKKHPDCYIYMLSNGDCNKDNSRLNFEIIGIQDRSVNYLLGTENRLRYIFINVTKKLLGKPDDIAHMKKFRKILKHCSGVFDISGFAISSQWGAYPTEARMNIVELFKKNNIPYYFMPQSFGPFEYGNDSDRILSRLKAIMPKCEVIFAREEEGYYMLKELIGTKNLKRSTDMVLQSKGIEKSFVFRNYVQQDICQIKTENNVAIIPNMRNFDHGNKNEILSLYQSIIQTLLKNNKHIYLISHSGEDQEACEMIKKCYADCCDVHIVNKKMDVFGFDEIIQHFEFAIASRFHSIVHSYKNAVPCIVFGWATKYHELLELFDQEEFMFDVRNLKSTDYAEKALNKMISCHSEESQKIKQKLEAIQEDNCFSQIEF